MSGMTIEQLNEFRDLLLAAQSDLQTSLATSTENISPVSPDKAIGRLTRQDAMQSQQMALEIRRRKEARLQQVQLAIHRLESGAYGICVRCEEYISLPRLRVQPEARLCVRCAQTGG